MTQQNEPDAELLLSKQRGILPPHEDNDSGEETSGAETRGEAISEEEFKRSIVDPRDLERSEPDHTGHSDRTNLSAVLSRVG